MKILAFAGSNSQNSINKKLVTWAAQQFDAASEVLDLNDYKAPIYSIDTEKTTGIPNAVLAFHNKIKEADLLLISLAEHNGAYTAAFKSLLDWLSRIPESTVFMERPIFLMATSPGGRGGKSVLEIAEGRFPRNGGVVAATFSLPKFYENFSEQEGIKNESMVNAFFEAKSKIA